ncbi:trimeric intracellular cation channel family protein [Chloroflexota bacterium]
MFYLDLFGVAVFAITGSLAAGKKQMDLFGVVMLAIVTALGGGTIRDLVLGAMPVFWVSVPIYVLVASATAILIFFIVRFFNMPYKLLSLADAVGLSIFTVVGTQKALALDTHVVIAVVMGVMTGVVGGMIRDILSGEIPLILKREIYATASLCGAIAFSSIYILLLNQNLAIIVSIIITLGLRLSAIKRNLSLPSFTSREE